jgi:hypothetical protein
MIAGKLYDVGVGPHGHITGEGEFRNENALRPRCGLSPALNPDDRVNVQVRNDATPLAARGFSRNVFSGEQRSIGLKEHLQGWLGESNPYPDRPSLRHNA